MTSEFKPRKMQTAEAHYVGAVLEDERRAVLVTLDPKDPWESFRSLRRAMKKEPGAARADFGLFASEGPVEHEAQVISLESRRQAG